MKADDVVATFDRLADPERCLQRAVGVQGHAVEGRHPEGRRPHGRLPPRRAERQLPLLGVDRQLQRRHPAGRLQGRLRKDLRRHRPVQAREATRRRSARPSCATTTIGARRRCRTALEFNFYADVQPRILALQAGEVDIIDAVPVDVSQVRCSTIPTSTVLQRRRRPRTTRCICAATRPVHRQARAPGAGAQPRPRQAGRRPVPGHGARLGNDSPFAPAFPVDRHSRCRSASRTSPRPSSCWRRPASPGGFDITLTTRALSRNSRNMRS